MRDVSDNWLEASQSSASLTARLTVHPPQATGVDSFEATIVSGTVDQESGTGQRWTASIDIAPEVGQRTWELVSWPGTWFTLELGMWFGAGQPEYMTFGEYVHADDPSYDRYASDPTISLNLADRWVDLDKTKFREKTVPKAERRIIVVEKTVRRALGSGVPISIRIPLEDGGDWDGGKSDDEEAADVGWEERTKLIEDMADDGGFQCYFDHDGVFVIDRELEDAKSPVVVLRGGDNVTDLSRGGRFVEYYNQAVIVPAKEEGDGAVEQNWDAQYATLDEPNHPLDPSNMRGMWIPYTRESKTITNAGSAAWRANRLLAEILRQDLQRDVTTFNMPHVELGDMVTIMEPATNMEDKRTERWRVVKHSHDIVAGTTSFGLGESGSPHVSEGQQGQSTPGLGLLPGPGHILSAQSAGVDALVPGAGVSPGGDVLVPTSLLIGGDDG